MSSTIFNEFLQRCGFELQKLDPWAFVLEARNFFFELISPKLRPVSVRVKASRSSTCQVSRRKLAARSSNFKVHWVYIHFARSNLIY